MAWYPRPPYPNDIIAGYLFSVGGNGLTLADNTGSGVTESRTFDWHLDVNTAYELLFGPFTYNATSSGNILQTIFTLTDGADYTFSLNNTWVCSTVPVYVSMFSRLFAVNLQDVTLTASFTVKRRKGIGSAFTSVTYALDTDPTLFAVRAVGKLDESFVDADGVVYSEGIKVIGPGNG